MPSLTVAVVLNKNLEGVFLTFSLFLHHVAAAASNLSFELAQVVHELNWKRRASDVTHHGIQIQRSRDQLKYFVHQKTVKDAT